MKTAANPDAVAVIAPKPMFEDSAVFQMACRQLDRVAEVVDLDQGVLERLSQPKRALVVSVPIQHGRRAHRVVRRLSRAAQPHQRTVQGGPALSSQRPPRRSRGPGHVDVVEVRHHESALRRRQGGHRLRPGHSSRIGELERLTRRFTVEVLPIIGPRMDVMAPDLGTDEQTMAWIMDTYSMSVGYACPEIVTGKPVELGGCVGRREATGRGVVYCIMQAMQELGLEPGQRHRRHSGVRQRRLGRRPGIGPARRRIVAVSDRYGAIANSKGIDVPALIAHAAAGKAVDRFSRSGADQPGRRADDALHHRRARRRGTRHQQQQRRPSCAAGFWPRAPTVRPRRTPTPSWPTATSSSSPTCCATPAA